MIVKRPKLSFWDRIYLPQILMGLWTTLKYIPRKKFTRQYPEEKPPLPERYRGVPTLVRDPEQRVKCVACQLCEFVCPPRAIRVIPGVRAETPSEAKVEKEPEDFMIDMGRCIYCGLCEEACPEEAIFLTNYYAMAGYSREQMVLHKDKLLEMGGIRADRIGKWKNK
jgi:NADH-quinone oxidoreductase subunit I